MVQFVAPDGKTYPERVGSKAKVWHGQAYCTKGGVTRSGLLKKPDGHIVFASRSRAALNGPGFKMLPKVKKGETPDVFKRHHEAVRNNSNSSK